MKTNTNYPTINGFRLATGDINYLDYGAIWYRKTGEREFHFITLINWEESVGEREAKEIGYKYNLRLALVDLAQIPADTVRSALSSCGNEDEQDDMWRALACLEYGAYAPLRDTDTSNFSKTFAEFAKLSRQIRTNKQARRRALSRKVNKLGSTAREFMKNDLTAAVVRGVVAEDPAALIIAKMNAAASKPDWER